MKPPSTTLETRPWSSLELRLHKKAVGKLEKIIKQAIKYIAQQKKLSEEQLYHFMVKRMQNANLTSMLGWVIVAYGSSAADPHYHFVTGKSHTIKPGHFLLLDIWGKVNRPDAPYADITHMYFVGKNPPDHFLKLWHDLREARNRALVRVTHACTTKGATLHAVAQRWLNRCGYQGMFIHGLGHDLGCDHVHGPGANLSPRWSRPLTRGRGYTIEPGIYKKGAFGVRSEMDFFLDQNGKVHVTTRLQQELECIP